MDEEEKIIFFTSHYNNINCALYHTLLYLNDPEQSLPKRENNRKKNRCTFEIYANLFAKKTKKKNPKQKKQTNRRAERRTKKETDKIEIKIKRGRESKREVLKSQSDLSVLSAFLTIEGVSTSFLH